MAAWLSKAGHEEMRAAARDVCKSDGACRALASASCLTHMEVFFPPLLFSRQPPESRGSDGSG